MNQPAPPAPGPALSTGSLLASKRLKMAVYALLALAPSLLFAKPLFHGAIPWFMDTGMYFFPLRVHAARLVAGGEWPLWNRCLMAGMPLFENPQAALAYPFHWPFLVWPSGFWFTFPMLLQLGLFGALTAWTLRRMGARRAASLWGGALALAGGYGWSRLQYGNYMNVLPWWPLWLGTAHAYAQRPTGKRLAVGAAAVAMMLLAGAHQLAAYGLASLAIYSLVQLIIDRERMMRWPVFGLVTLGLGLLIGAPGWVPQLGFIAQTPRPGGLSPDQVLVGAIQSWEQLARALAGEWDLVTLYPVGPWADAEGTASIGLAALALAALTPRREGLRRAWLGCWVAAAMAVFFSLRPVVGALAILWPGPATLFHDPRRWLGVAQWFLLLAAGLGAAGLYPRESDGSTRPTGPSPKWWRRSLRYLPPVALIAACAWPMARLAPAVTSLNLALAGLALALASWQRAKRFIAPRMALFLLSAALLGHATWVSTDLKTMPARNLLAPAHPPLILQAGLQPGQRFFTVDWQRAASYDYERPDLLDWALPNLGMLWGLEDLGGYEPAQSVRYRAFVQAIHAREPSRQPYAQHFGLIQNPADPAPLDQANVSAALMPRWGVPCFFRREGEQSVWGAAFPSMFREPFSVCVALTSFASARPDILLACRDGKQIRNIDLGSPLPPSKAMDLVAAASDSPTTRSEPPAAEHLMAAVGRVQPPADPSFWWIALSPRSRLLDLFAWGPELARLWRLEAVAQLAALMRYEGAPSWTSWQGGDGSGKVSFASIRANRLELEIEAPANAPTHLIIHDAFWPGWRAWIDGKRVAVESAGLWRAVAVGPGTHKLTMAYRPPLVPASLGLAAAGVLAALWIARRKAVARL